MLESAVESASVDFGFAPAEPATELRRCIVAVSRIVRWAQQIVGKSRHQSTRQQEGPKQGEGDGLGQRPEQVTGNAGELEQRRENDADADQRDECRHDDLPGAVHDGLFSGFPCSRCQLMFSSVTVPSSTRIPTASARPPSVITLMVSPSQDSAVSENNMASGISIMMIKVERQLPRNSRIISPVSAAAIAPSCTTPVTAARTKGD